jgi:hypothetical protein
VKIVNMVVVIYFLLLHMSYARNRGTCVTPQNVTRNLHRWVSWVGKEANTMLSCSPRNVGRNW